MNQDQLKRSAAEAALAYLLPRLERDTIVGIGTGSTANHFIDLLASFYVHKLPLRQRLINAPATIAEVAVIAMRLRSVFIDI